MAACFCLKSTWSAGCLAALPDPSMCLQVCVNECNQDDHYCEPLQSWSLRLDTDLVTNALYVRKVEPGEPLLAAGVGVRAPHPACVAAERGRGGRDSVCSCLSRAHAQPLRPWPWTQRGG